MCGIVARLGPRHSGVREILRRGQDALRHRGPDGAGAWLGEHAAIGHVRLATIGIPNGAQPIASEDSQVVAAVSGEFYGDGKLRQQLEARGHRFRTASDSEVLVHLFEDEGPAAFSRLNGEFAFVLWDQSSQSLYAARDPFGARPLLFARAQEDGALLFANEAKGLFAMGATRKIDEASLAVALSVQYCVPGETLFEGVTELRPGEARAFSASGKTLRSWSIADAHEAGDSGASLDDCAAESRAALEQAVSRRLRADVPVCTQLSGGLDSTAVAALARARVSGPLTAYTVSFRPETSRDAGASSDAGDSAPGTFDEGRAAAESARALDLDHRVVALDAPALLDELPRAVAHAEGLSVNLHIAAKSLLARRMRQDGFAVTLTGEGADEVFLGYPHLRVDAGFHAPSAAHPGSAALMLPHGDASNDTPCAREKLATWALSKVLLGSRARSFLSDASRERVDHHAPLARFGHALTDSELRSGAHLKSAAEGAAATWSDFALAGYILKTLGDATELHHAIEGRLPFLDRDLVRAARAMPLGVKIDGPHGGKRVLREALRGVVPESVRTREKHPFISPAPTAHQMESFVNAQLTRDAFGPHGRFDADAIRGRVSALRGSDHAERLAWLAPLLLVFSAAWIEEEHCA